MHLLFQMRFMWVHTFLSFSSHMHSFIIDKMLKLFSYHTGDVFYANWSEVLVGATAVVSTIGGLGSEEQMKRINGEANIVAVNAAKDFGKNCQLLCCSGLKLKMSILIGNNHIFQKISLLVTWLMIQFLALWLTPSRRTDGGTCSNLH